MDRRSATRRRRSAPRRTGGRCLGSADRRSAGVGVCGLVVWAPGRLGGVAVVVACRGVAVWPRPEWVETQSGRWAE
ncbi:hypothetical protein GUJ93_ZPchr0007g4973 [Zizania palustris]|uniref:Uncharacterized protein n=1 Tax=Zizania palustris TaxID=103762 RepID=A0A8J5VYX2_ZIZPA|nr:hypothetical protein GUJ93_ZPchr0007g4973 [Zizania palustris]